MLNSNILFSNLFRSSKITAMRLLLFGKAVIANLTTGNDKGQFTAIITTLTTALNTLEKELVDIDTSLNDQKTDTKSVDAFVAGFIKYMSTKEPFIAEALGGKNSAGYLALYPGKLSEYTKATRTTMPVLTQRVQNAAVKYAADLGTSMAITLQAFAPGYVALQSSQQNKKSNVKKGRDGRGSTFEQVQLVLTTAVFTVGAQYPGDVAKCSSFFPFSMLYPQKKNKRYQLSGTLAHGATQELLNQNLNKSAVITIRNTGSNSLLNVWLATAPTDVMPANAIEIKAGTSHDIKATELGDLNNTFLMIKNTSAINDGTYEVIFTGLTKKVNDAVQPSDMEVVRA